MRTSTVLGILAAVCLSTFSGQAAVIQFSAPMTTGQEVPSPDVTGGFTPTGLGTAVIDTEASTLQGTMSWSGLTTGAFMGHIHRRPLDSPVGPVVVGYFMLDPLTPLGTTDSVVTPTIDLTPEQLTSLIEGLSEGTLYFNLHSVRNRPGEIRGDISTFVVIPEPGTYALLGGGLIAMIAFRRRRS